MPSLRRRVPGFQSPFTTTPTSINKLGPAPAPTPLPADGSTDTAGNTFGRNPVGGLTIATPEQKRLGAIAIGNRPPTNTGTIGTSPGGPAPPYIRGRDFEGAPTGPPPFNPNAPDPRTGGGDPIVGLPPVQQGPIRPDFNIQQRPPGFQGNFDPIPDYRKRTPAEQAFKEQGIRSNFQQRNRLRQLNDPRSTLSRSGRAKRLQQFLAGGGDASQVNPFTPRRGGRFGSRLKNARGRLDDPRRFLFEQLRQGDPGDIDAPPRFAPGPVPGQQIVQNPGPTYDPLQPGEQNTVFRPNPGFSEPGGSGFRELNFNPDGTRRQIDPRTGIPITTRPFGG
jgi:hypothetical protein